MALASVPWPMNLVAAGMTAAAGALAYAQASNSASSQLAGLESSSSSSSNMSLTVGDETGQSVDVSNSSTSAERSESLGDAGVLWACSRRYGLCR